MTIAFTESAFNRDLFLNELREGRSASTSTGVVIGGAHVKTQPYVEPISHAKRSWWAALKAIWRKS